MSDVIIRCPNCGTTQSALGECEACHEDQARYFCTNHTPGRWLDGPTCTGCGAQFGRERVASHPPPARPPSPRTPPPRRPAPPADPRPRSPRPPVGDRPTRVPVTVRRGPPDVDERDGYPDLPDLYDVAPPPRRPADAHPGVRLPPVRISLGPVFGCIGKLMFLGVLLLLAAAAAIFALMSSGGAMRGWVVDVGQQMGVVEGVPAQTLQGIEAYRAGDLARAERELREAARSYRRSGVALVYLARIRMDAGDLERGGEYLREAVAREPANALAHRELAGYYFTRARRLLADPESEAYARDELLRARQHYERSLALDPADPRARGYYGCVLADLGDSTEGARLAEQAGSGPWEECAGGARQ